MPQPKVTVVVPMYNVADFLVRSLSSIQRQSFGDWECVCIDDGSQDVSALVAQTIVRQDGRFRLVQARNGGVALARERGVLYANGDWIGWVDPDDWVESTFLEHLVQRTHESIDLVWTDFQEEREKTKRYVSQSVEGGVPEFVRTMLTGYAWGGIWNKLFRREIIVREGLSFLKYKLPICEDFCFLLSFLRVAGRIIYALVSVYLFFIWRGSLLHYHRSPGVCEGVVAQRVQQCIECEARQFNVDDLLMYRKKVFKFAWYTLNTIPDVVFWDAFKEVKEVDDLDVNRIHKVLFRLANTHFRPLVRMVFRGFRWSKKVFSSDSLPLKENV